MRCTTSFHEPAGGSDLVRAVDRHVQPRERVDAGERLHAEAELAGRRRGRDRGGDAAEIEVARCEYREQVGDGRPGSEPDEHSVLDELRSRFCGELLLPFGAHGRTTLAGGRPGGDAGGADPQLREWPTSREKPDEQGRMIR